jgi:hypothetical protein
MTNGTIDWREFAQVLEDMINDVPSENGQSIELQSENEIKFQTAPKHNVHHSWKRFVNGVLQKFTEIRLPAMQASGITASVPKGSNVVTHFIHADVYANWPLGKEPGQDPRGDEIKDFINLLETAYMRAMDKPKNAALRTKILTHVGKVGEERTRAGAVVKKTVDNIEDEICPTINYSVYPAGHALEGKVDDSKSPTVKFKLWESKATEANSQNVRSDSLFAYGDSAFGADGAAPNLRIWTKIYDRRANKGNSVPISKTSDFEQFTYRAGDSARGKSQQTMDVIPTILNPTCYWEAGKEMSGTMQLKLSALVIGRTKALQGSRAVPTKVLLADECEFDDYRKTYNKPDQDPDEMIGEDRTEGLEGFSQEQELAGDVPGYDQYNEGYGGLSPSSQQQYAPARRQQQQQYQQQQQQQQTQGPRTRSVVQYKQPAAAAVKRTISDVEDEDRVHNETQQGEDGGASTPEGDVDLEFPQSNPNAGKFPMASNAHRDKMPRTSGNGHRGGSIANNGGNGGK